VKMSLLRFIGATSVDFPIIGADASGPFVLKSVEGLGPPEINVRMARTVLEKALYQGKSANLRQIIALVGLQPDWDEGQTPEELRTQLYSLLTPRYGQMVKAQIINNGTVQAFAQGQISKLEAAIFTKDPAVSITLDCDYGYLLSPNTVTQAPAQRTVNTDQRAFDVANDGTAPAGFILDMVLRANVDSPLVLKDSAAGGQRISVKGIDWKAGDRLVIDTRAGSRGVWRGAGGGALVSVLNNLDADISEWMQLYAGDNTLIINTAAFDWSPAGFQHQPAFWGV
jgi:hypothetical protein